MSHFSEDQEDYESCHGDDVTHSEVDHHRSLRGEKKHSELSCQLKRQHSKDYEVVVAMCLECTYTAPSGKFKLPQFHKGDCIQIISVWSIANDGVLQVRKGDLSADGVVNQSDGTEGNDTAYFQCQNLADDPATLTVLPCWRKARKFTFQNSNSPTVQVLAGSIDGPDATAGSLSLKAIEPKGDNVRADRQCTWTFEPLEPVATGASSSRSRIWRIYVTLETAADANGRSIVERFFITAERSGKVLLTKEDRGAGVPCSKTTAGMENPKTYFYLYKQAHVEGGF